MPCALREEPSAGELVSSNAHLCLVITCLPFLRVIEPSSLSVAFFSAMKTVNFVKVRETRNFLNLCLLLNVMPHDKKNKS